MPKKEDWPTRLALLASPELPAAARSVMTDEALEDSEHWGTCAVGEITAGFWGHAGPPRGTMLRSSGIEFAERVQCHEWIEALRVYNRLETAYKEHRAFAPAAC